MSSSKSEFKRTLRLCLETSDKLIISLLRQLAELAEPKIGGGFLRSLLSIIRPHEIDQDALASMPEDLADSYISERMQLQNFMFFFDKRPFRYTELPKTAQEALLNKHLPMVFWRSIGQIAGYSIWIIPFAFLYGMITPPSLTLVQAILGGILFVSAVALILYLFMLLGVLRRFRPFPYARSIPIDFQSLKLGFVSWGLTGLVFYPATVFCLVDYCLEAFLLEYVILVSLVLSLYLMEEYFKVWVLKEIMSLFKIHLQNLSSIRFALSSRQSSYNTEKEAIESHMRTLERVMRAQSQPIRSRSAIRAAISILAGFVLTVIQAMLFPDRSWIIDQITKLAAIRTVIWFFSASLAIAMISNALSRILSGAEVRRMVQRGNVLETVMEAATKRLLFFDQ